LDNILITLIIFTRFKDKEEEAKLELLSKFYQAVFDELKTNPDMPFHKNHKEYEITTPEICVAPPLSTQGKKHVDCYVHNKHLEYTVWLPLGPVSEDNGCVTIWTSTCGINFDLQNPDRYCPEEGPSMALLSKGLGDGYLFDARFHHRSEMNKTKSTRAVALFAISLIKANMGHAYVIHD
jgi:hypothetical protein